MPTQDRIGSDNEQRLPPERRGASEQQEFDAIEVVELRPFALALQDDELLAQEGVLGNEVGLAASEISSSSNHRGMGVGLKPALDVSLNDAEQSTPALTDVC